ncbi:ATP-dependent DNA helicase RecQ [Nocardioides sp. ChNu-153]|uniref:RecQ family ATP-dependent DNA helicase n=1 Tax=unclassified Nocardioides TaxID=2615069 RepID=UPI002405AF59|nr:MULTISPECIES: RecQ family ATP-dependent DNA helicase [unclassified Nocardioides]MDF9716670.1 RecQ family ATP-dependent DNA helicase [Nocardioides sp. ChNu-99]MDN7123041.1 ATP-dependent DNA helicase RecQ [Nocardioides sp. ChNu-153]
MTSPSGAPTVDRAAAREEAERHLQALVGRDDARLRDDQWTAIEALAVDRRRALVVQRTGWGKSAVYFVATLLLRAQGAGPTVIVSPLLALMRNQIAAAQRAGVRAVTINSTNPEDWEQIHTGVAAGEVDVLLVSPERLNNPTFRDEVLPRLSASAGLLVVDEAHCISDWGHDFRPDYRRIRTLLAELPDGVPVLATTATANARVTRDVAEQLEAGGAPVLVLRGSLDRESLHLGVVRFPTSEQRLAWLTDHLRTLPGSGIIYCLTVAATQEVAQHLREQGHHVAAYSGQTDPTERASLEAALAAGEVKALVATSALGMGFDATLGFVVNLGAPSSPVSYYQQVGRAGRGTEQAEVVLLPGREDRDIWAYFGSLAFPPERLVRQTIDALDAAGRPLSTAVLETEVELGRNRLETMLKVLDVDGAVRRTKGGWESTGQPWTYDAERYARVAESREREQSAMLAYLETDVCRMRFLRSQLDDPVPDGPEGDCGRCDNCGGLTLDAGLDEAAVEQARARLDRPGVVIEPRKMWPSGLDRLGVELKGRIKNPAEEGRAVARLTDLGHGQALRDLFREGPEGAYDGPVPVPLVQAVVEVLGEWRPQVDQIVVVDSMTHGALVRDLASGLSRYLGVPVVGSWSIADPSIPTGAGAANSAQRVAAVRRRSRLDLDLADDGRLGRVLLVDDRVVTGWTLTLAAAALLEAGASAVVPLVLATQS